VNQVEGVHAGFDLDERDRKVQRLDDDGLERREVELAAHERTQRAPRDFGQRASRQARELVGAPRLDRLRHVQPAIGREPVEQRSREGRTRAAARGQEAPGATTRAPCAAIADTYVCGAARIAATTAAAIAAATRSATARPRQSANSDGPDPDKLQPSAPASAAARLIAASPGTSGARRGSA